MSNAVGEVFVVRADINYTPIGMIGVCYQQYTHGKSIIFKNGFYCGYNEYEEYQFLTMVGFYVFNYNFKNVMQLTRDFDNKVFDKIFDYGYEKSNIRPKKEKPFLFKIGNKFNLRREYE